MVWFSSREQHGRLDYPIKKGAKSLGCHFLNGLAVNRTRRTQLPDLFAAEERLKRHRNPHGAIRLLMIFNHRDEGAA
jgi:hypothetical protein